MAGKLTGMLGLTQNLTKGPALYRELIVGMVERIFDGKKIHSWWFFDDTNENVQRCSSDATNAIIKKRYLNGMVEFKNGNFAA